MQYGIKTVLKACFDSDLSTSWKQFTKYLKSEMGELVQV